MKKTILWLSVFLCLFSPLSVFAESIDNSGQEAPKTESLISLSYGKILVDDLGHIFTAPFYWERKDWFIAGMATGAVLTLYIFDDTINEQMSEQRGVLADKNASGIDPFGAEYSLYILGAFEAGGIIFNDDNARAVAQDGLSASLSTVGVVTALKYVIGRDRPSKDKGARHNDPFGGGDSFPSGHTAQAFTVATVIAEHYDVFWIKLTSYGMATAVAWARVEQKVHWPSDILGGGLLGIFIGKEIVRFNKNKRYELSVFFDKDTGGGLRVSHRF